MDDIRDIINKGSDDKIDPEDSCDSLASALSFIDSLLNNSRITPTGNGNLSGKPFCTQPTGGQKWWAAVILGFIFALISSPTAYNITSSVGIKTTEGKGPTLSGLLVHTIIFIIVMRIILW
jgi:hypothetical protein